MSQTRTQSLLEASTGVFIGYLVSLLAQMLILPLYGVYVSFSDNLFCNRKEIDKGALF